MVKEFLIEKIRKILNAVALPAVIYAENLVGKGFGDTKKQIALDFIINKLPIWLLPFKKIIKNLLSDLFDFVIEEGVKKLHQIQQNLPQAL